MIRDRDDRHLRMMSSITDLGAEIAARKLVGGEVSLCWSPSMETHPAGQAAIRACANLVVRFCPNVRILPLSTFAADLDALLRAIDPSAQPGASPSNRAVRLVLGGGLQTGDVTASAREWVAYVSGKGIELPPFQAEGNVLGALAAAAFAAAEVFKCLLPPKPERGQLVDHAAYSLFTYGTPGTGEPVLGSIAIETPTLLVGMGAVGQAFLDSLISSGTSGPLTVVDKGAVDAVTDLNRCVLAEIEDVIAKRPKVDLAVRRAIGSGLRLDPHAVDFSVFADKIDDGHLEWPTLALSTLDNNEARHRLQKLWPDLLLEAATGDTMAQVFRFDIDSDLACLKCIHPLVEGDIDYPKKLAEVSGLSLERVHAALNGTADSLSDSDLLRAPETMRGLLASQIGRDLCGVLSEIERYAASGRSLPVQPSVSFTSYLAGVFLASEFLKATAGLPTALPGRYQIDPIANLFPDSPWPEQPNPSCLCVTRRESIRAYRMTIRR